MRLSALPALLALSAVSACNQPDPIAAMQARQAAADPPQLWSVQVTDASARPGDKPILMCTDRLIRTGFLNQHAFTQTDSCQPERAPVVKPDSVSMRCAMGGESYAIYNAAKGDQAKDFQVTFTMRSIQGDAVSLRQTRRYRHIGPCPAGWKIGDATDRYGRPAANGMQ
ncbi:MAG: hypothetical protein JWP35_1456 [Caulobacter sp.]|nr:hypothetical protein [Caulobacter sp.]